MPVVIGSSSPHRTLGWPSHLFGVFDWHYLQCVLNKFATPDYKKFDNINYFSFPFRTRDDEDESDIDERNIVNPPSSYPPYHWDLAEARARQRLEVEERDQAILTWNTHHCQRRPNHHQRRLATQSMIAQCRCCWQLYQLKSSSCSTSSAVLCFYFYFYFYIFESVY